MVEEAACELIRSLPYCTDLVNSSSVGQWYYDFLEACLCDGKTRFLPKFIDPYYEIDLGIFCLYQVFFILKRLIVYLLNLKVLI